MRNIRSINYPQNSRIESSCTHVSKRNHVQQRFFRLSNKIRILIWLALGFATSYGALQFFEEIWSQLILSVSMKILLSTLFSLGSAVILANEKIWRVVRDQRILNQLDRDIDSIKIALNPVQTEIFEHQKDNQNTSSDLDVYTDGWSLIRLGQRNLDDGLDKKGVVILEKALSIFRKSDDQMGLIETLDSISEAYRRTQRLTEAEILIRECIEITDSSEEYSKTFRMVFCLGRILIDGGKPDLGISYLEESLGYTEYVDEEILCLCTIGFNYIQRGKNKLAEEILTQALSIAEKHERAEDIWSVTNTLSQLFLKLGDFSKALDYNRIGIESSLSDSMTDLAHAVSLDIKGTILVDLKEYKKAKEIFHECVKISKQSNDTTLRGNMLHNLSVAYCKLGDMKKYEEYLLESLEYQKQFSLRINPDTLINVGWLELDKGNFDSAELKFLEVLEIYRENDIRTREANVLGNLGLLELKKKNYQRAETYYNRSLAIDRELGNKVQIVGGLRDLADLMALMGNKEKSSELLAEALEIELEIGAPILEDTFFD